MTLSDKIQHKKISIGWDANKKNNDYLDLNDVKEFIKELKDRINSPINAESLRGYNVQRLWFFKELDKLAGEKLIWKLKHNQKI